MSYFNQFKNATRETKRLLVLLALMFGFSALAATHKVSEIAVDPSTLDDGAQVVMYHNSTGKLVGCQNGKEVTKDNKEVTDADANYYVFIIKKSGDKIALQNGAGYVPQVTGSGRYSVSFSFAWKTSVTSSSYFNVSYNSASDVARLYIEYTYWWTTYSGYMSRTNSGMSAKQDPDNTAADDADWTFHQYVLDDGTGGHGTAPTKHSQLKAWADNAGYQEVGYIGLGNKNQVLASACVNIKNGDIPTIAYRLFGKTNFLSAVSVYARKRDTAQDYTPDGSYATFENTFAHIFDYRNPEKNCGAIFLGFTYDVPEEYAPATFTSNVKLETGEYVIYLVANTKTAEEIGGLDKLPLIGGSSANFTRVGGVIETVTCGTNTYTIKTVNNYSKDGGGRVFVPKYELLYAPKYGKYATSVEYSKYYRIPAITRASDGTLVALSDARKNHIHDVTNNIDVVSRRSSDNGKTWSDYLVIFQGSEEGSTDCYNWKGYGDAAVAAFPNGTVMATAIHGFGLAGTSTDPATDVVWKVSRDNGKTWSSEYTMKQSLFGGLRGNISPGNICVANKGYIDGKALVGLRTSTSPNKGSGSTASYQRIYCLTYNPDKNEWTPVSITSGNYTFDYLENSSNSLDEVQFVQVDDNQFILSARSSASGGRLFYRLTFTSPTEATATQISQSGMNLANPCNGDILKYAAKGGIEYILHTVPKDMVYTNDNCRTSLSAYYTTVSKSGGLTWSRSIDLFDPFDNTNGGEAKSGIGAMDEAAQYSSLSMQEDGTIAVTMEAYPYAIRHQDQESSSYKRHWGDWVMGQYYMNLRIGDIIPGAEQPAAQVIDAPVISPKSSTYDSYKATDRPEITISHQNYVNYPDNYNTTDKKVKTLYEFEYYDADGKRLAVSKISESEFTEETKTLTWQDVYKALGYTSDPTLKQNGYSVRVSAYCVSANDAQVISKKDVKIYTFANPVRRIKVVGLPTSGASKTELSTQGSSVGSDVWLTVGLGQEVQLNAPAVYPFTFVGFYYQYEAGDKSKQVPLSDKLDYTNLSGIANQIKFTVPSEDVTPNNYVNENGVEDYGIVIYAVYEVQAGFSTRVNTQYNNGVVNGTTFESQYSYWAPKQETTYIDRIVNAKGGDEFDKNLSLPVAPKQDNVFLGGNGKGDAGALTYPQQLTYGLDAYVTLVPDSKAASHLNAIVRVKKGDTYLQNYYVVNGSNQAIYGNIATNPNCAGVFRWYKYVDGELCPVAVGMRSYEVGSNPKQNGARRSIVEGGANGAWYKVDTDIAFEGICAKGEDFNGLVTVEIYLVTNDIVSISQLSDPNSYITKVSHSIVRDEHFTTGVEDVNAEKTVAGVVYYNLLGAASDRPFEGVNVVVTTYTDGTKSSKKILR